MKIQIAWEPRSVPLPPCAVYVPHSKKHNVLSRLLKYPDEYLGNLEGLHTDRCVLILGQEMFLPWVEGCIYLGRDSKAPHLLISVLHQPNVPVSLLDSAIYKKTQQNVAMIPGSPALIPTNVARRLSEERLRGILA